MGAKLQRVVVKLPWVEGEIVADDEQQQAAWELYVELVTRVAVQPLHGDEGLLREALSSFYQLFAETRRILKDYGPDVARPARKHALSIGQLAVDVLNRSLRPLLAAWHPRLQAYEGERAPGVSPLAHERAWAHHDELRAAIEQRRGELEQYASLLAELSGVPPLHETPAG